MFYLSPYKGVSNTSQSIDGQVHLVRIFVPLVRLQAITFVRSFVNKQANKNFCLHDEQMVNGLRKTARRARFPLDVSMSMSQCLCLNVSI
jgi:hypothetical protein